MRSHQQFAQVAGGGNVALRQAGRLDKVRAGHAQRLGLGVHCRDKSSVAARIVMGEAGGGAVFRRHQGDQQHLAARQLTLEFDPGEHALHFRGVPDVDIDPFVHVLSSFYHDQARHQLADGSDRHDHVRVAGIDDFIGLHIHEQGAAGRDLQCRSVTWDSGGFRSVDRWRDECACNSKQQAQNRETNFHAGEL